MQKESKETKERLKKMSRYFFTKSEKNYTIGLLSM